MTDVPSGESPASGLPSGTVPPTNSTKTNDQQAPTPLASRRSENRLLFTTAVIAALAGILGASVGAVASYARANIQSRTAADVENRKEKADADAERGKEQAAAILAQRQERKEAYADYLTILDDLENAEYQRGQALNDPGAVSDYNHVHRQWARQDDIVRLVASKEVNIIRGKLVELIFDVQQIMDNQAGFDPVAFDAARKNVVQTGLDFSDAATRDLEQLGHGQHP